MNECVQWLEQLEGKASATFRDLKTTKTLQHYVI